MAKADELTERSMIQLANGHKMPAIGLSLPASLGNQSQNSAFLEQQKCLLRTSFNAGCRHFNFCLKWLKSANGGGGGGFAFGKMLAEWIREEGIQREELFISIRIDIGANGKGGRREELETIKMNIEEMIKQNGTGCGGMALDLVVLKVTELRGTTATGRMPREKPKESTVVNMDKTTPRGAKTPERPLDPMLLNLCHSIGTLQADGHIRTFGLAGGNLQMEELEQINANNANANDTPQCWQVDLSELFKNFEGILEERERMNLRLIVNMENVIGIGMDGGGTIFHNLLREVAKKYGKTATQVLYGWLNAHSMAILYPSQFGSQPKRIGQQMESAKMAIGNWQISPEDMKRLNGFFQKDGMPSPYKIAQKSGSQTTRQLMSRRRLVGDVAFGLALIGIGLMVMANEFAFVGLWQFEQAARIGILVSTFALLLATIRYHWIDLKLLICSICPLPGLEWPLGDPFLCSLMFGRLYWLPRCLHLHSRLSTDAAAKSIAGLNRVKTDTRFMLKRMLFLYPGLALSAFVFNFWLIGAYVLRLCESNIYANSIQSYYNALWMMCVTFLTIGYGDIYPVTSCGRLMAIMTGVIGVCVASMIVAVIVQKISLSQAEERVQNFMARTKHARSLKETAAQVLKESWFLYKNRRMPDQICEFWVCQEQRVRHHERRLSAAICSLRKLRKEQRVLQEVDGISLDEVAKVSQNALEMVRLMGNEQRTLNDRITSMEMRLGQIHQGIDLLLADMLERNPRALAKAQRITADGRNNMENGSINEEPEDDDEDE